MANLTLMHLRMLTTITQTNSLSQAAAQLHITQSALSHRIREAERRLGVTLFEKSGRRQRLTPAAQVLVDAAVKILDDIDAAERVAIASAEGVQHVVRLTVANYNAYHWLPGFLASFHEIHPEIEIEIVPGGFSTTLEQLSSGEIDIAIVPNQSFAGAFEATELFQDELVVVLWPGHPFEEKAFVSGKDFEDQIYLTYSLHSQPGFESERLWSDEGVSPMRKRNLGSVDAVCELVNAHAGISVLSRWGIHRQINSGNLIARQATADGLNILWYGLVSTRLPNAAAGRTVLTELGNWFSKTKT